MTSTCKRSRSPLDSSTDRVTIKKRKATSEREKSDLYACGDSSRGSSPRETEEQIFLICGSKKRKADTKKESSPKKLKVCSGDKASTGKAATVSVAVSVKRKASPSEASPNKKRRTAELQISSCNDTEEQSESRDKATIAAFRLKYVQLEKLGEGGFGCVYAGVRRADSLPVAIKRIRGLKEQQDYRKEIIPNEVQIMQQVIGEDEFGTSAPVSLLDYYHVEEELIIVMERPVPSITLSEYLNNQDGPLTEEQAKDFMSQMVKAAVDMHKKGVFHRDLKAQNLLVENYAVAPRIRVIDFGCASTVLNKVYKTFFGTHTLAPAEWLLDDRYKAAPCTVWQLGALMYRMLHKKTFQTMSYVYGAVEFSKNLSVACRDFLSQCLTINPKERLRLLRLQEHPWLTAKQETS